MKKILVTGANSYIGTSFEKYIQKNYPDDYVVDTTDMIDGSWREMDFSEYDSVFHVAGLAHQKETVENAHLYYEINRDLAFETAEKAKAAGVGQFVFLSSMSVYGKETGVVTKDTPPTPKTNYGRSKAEAEEKLLTLTSPDFKLCILRPPMVYGEGCRGNYHSIVKLVEKLPVFPRVNNRRSAIRVDNLTRFVIMAIERELSGVYFPQNAEYASTCELAREIAQQKKKQLYFSFLCGFGVILLRPFSPILQKAFGDLVYEGTEEFDFSYCKKDA